MNGRTAKRIRDLIGYDKENPNPIQKRLYKKLKEQYASLGPEVFWKRAEGRFNNN